MARVLAVLIHVFLVWLLTSIESYQPAHGPSCKSAPVKSLTALKLHDPLRNKDQKSPWQQHQTQQRRKWQPHKILPRQSENPLSIEGDLQQQKQGFTHVIGSDDSGFGCIAGPVITASCCILVNLEKEDNVGFRPIAGVMDSKALTAARRRAIFDQVMQQPEYYSWSITARSAAEIDNSSSLQQATLDGFRESIEQVSRNVHASCATEASPNFYSIVDGHKSPAHLPFPCRPWVRGDSMVYTVALASILARVTHENIMEQQSALYPAYRLAENLGYPTMEHTLALHQYGPCPIHRQSCKPVRSRRMYGRSTVNDNAVSSGVSRQSFLTAIISTIGISLAVWSKNPKSAMATYTDPKNGIAFPDAGELEAAIPNNWSEEENPLGDNNNAKALSRLDSTSDSIFYSDPRFVEHVDEQAVKLMTDYISTVAISTSTRSVLDLCSSWTSHMDTTVPSIQSLTRVAGLGMNAKELQANPVLTEWTTQDLNQNATLPYDNESFDVVLCQLSIDYLTQPLQVCQEIGRVLRPGGTVHILFSNRLFLSKAVALWTGADDVDHAYTVAAYLHFCNGGFDDSRIEASDLSVRKGRDKRIVGDPLYVVRATKL